MRSKCAPTHTTTGEKKKKAPRVIADLAEPNTNKHFLKIAREYKFIFDEKFKAVLKFILTNLFSLMF